jgi:PAS domain-containing protein
MYGFSAEEAVGRVSRELLQDALPGRHGGGHVPAERQGNMDRELTHTAKGGRVLVAESALQLYRDEDGRKLVLQLCRDVTERLQRQQEIENQQSPQRVFENLHEALFIYDGTGWLKAVNGLARELYPDQLPAQATYEILHMPLRIFTLDGNLVPKEEYVTARAFRGETVRNERYLVENGFGPRPSK